MKELFGIPMITIMWVLVALFAVCVSSVVAIWLSNRIMFRMGLRNVPRRGAQTVLVVLGLMLSTLIITTAFTTGDSLDYSITKGAYDQLQRTDLLIAAQGSDAAGDGAGIYVDERFVVGLEAAFRDDADIAGFVPFLNEPVPALNARTKLSEPFVRLTGVDLGSLDRFGGLTLAGGGRANLNALVENDVLVSATLADKIDAREGDVLTVYARGAPWELRVAGVVTDQFASGVNCFGCTTAGGMTASLATVQRITGHPGQINLMSVSLQGDVRSSVARTDSATERLEAYIASDQGKAALGLGELTIDVEKVKQEAVEQAETFGNLFTTFFLVLGLFSIAAGILLIFMIFVMLAAERKPEMGMARAIGAKRANLVQSFVSEGMAYNIMAGAVGAALGVAASYFLVIEGTRAVSGDLLSFFEGHVTVRSLVISYCLGVVLTFLTVVISSLRISQLNIVAAIRGTDDFKRREGRRKTHWRWVALGVPALIIPPLGLWFLLRKGFGLPWAWIVGPTGIALGALLMLWGKSIEQAFPFSLGISLIPLSVAALARYYHAPNRLTWSIVGGLLSLYWLMPDNVLERLFGKLNGNIEMFVLSGIMIVTGFTLLIVFNARLLTTLFEGTGSGSRYQVPAILAVLTAITVAVGVALGDRGDGLGQLFYLLAALLAIGAITSWAAARFPLLAPALKMGVAYPLASRFRTGMTIAMFSLIVFSLTVMSVLNANFSALFSGDDARAGWDVIADTNRNNPVPDLRAALREEGSFDPSPIADIAGVSVANTVQDVRQIGATGDWKKYPVRAGDAAFYEKNAAKLDLRATGYDSDEQVFAAVRDRPNLAIIDALAVPNGNFGGSEDVWKATGIKLTDKVFTPFDVEFRDALTGKSGRVTVIGVFSAKIQPDVLIGIFTNEQTFTPVYGTPDYRRLYLRLAPGADSEAAAKGIKAALVTRGVQAVSIEKQVEDAMAQGRGFNRIFQAFMGMGLFVGIAALGVIAFRAVVERRQQIGMLRAIGYQRGTVALTFLLESSFVALMGILSGVIGAAILSRNLMTSDSFTGTTNAALRFFIPWTEVIVFVVIAYVFSLLMTWWPSRGASRVPIADALRYE